jgi:hypothetical protein
LLAKVRHHTSSLRMDSSSPASGMGKLRTISANDQVDSETPPPAQRGGRARVPRRLDVSVWAAQEATWGRNMTPAFLTLVEVAQRLQVKPLWLDRWLRRHPLDANGAPL